MPTRRRRSRPMRPRSPAALRCRCSPPSLRPRCGPARARRRRDAARRARAPVRGRWRRCLSGCFDFDRFSYRYPAAQAAGASRRLDLGRGRRVRRPRRALGLGQVEPPARRLRPDPALPRRRGRGRAQVCGLDLAIDGPAELGGAVGLVAQDPETQVVSATVRGELELPLELRGEPRRRAPARSRRSRWRSAIERLLDRADRRRSPAASCSASRSPRRSSRARGWSCSTSRPRSSTRSPATS